MGAAYLIDTNALSDYLGSRVSLKALDFMDTIMDNTPAISVINRIELKPSKSPATALSFIKSVFF